MLPRRVIDSVFTPEGRELLLVQHGDAFHLEVAGEELMSSRMHGSEEALAEHVVARLAPAAAQAPQLLVGGLGMGYTLRATLEALGDRPRAVVHVVEVFDAVVTWNRGPLSHLAGRPLEDARVRVLVDDVVHTVRGSRDRFDAILLDVDNGPDAFTLDSNHRLYTPGGLERLHAALREDGVLGVWSAYSDRHFPDTLARAGFEVEVERVHPRAGHGRRQHVLFLGRRRPARPGRRPARGRTGGGRP